MELEIAGRMIVLRRQVDAIYRVVVNACLGKCQVRAAPWIADSAGEVRRPGKQPFHRNIAAIRYGQQSLDRQIAERWRAPWLDNRS